MIKEILKILLMVSKHVIMEDQNISTTNQTRTTTKLSAPALRDSKKKSQVISKKTVSRQGKGRK